MGVVVSGGGVFDVFCGGWLAGWLWLGELWALSVASFRMSWGCSPRMLFGGSCGTDAVVAVKLRGGGRSEAVPGEGRRQDVVLKGGCYILRLLSYERWMAGWLWKNSGTNSMLMKRESNV